MELVLAAAVTAIGGIFATAIGSWRETRKLRRENEIQHLVNKSAAEAAAQQIVTAVDNIDRKLDSHIEWHAHNPVNQARFLTVVKENES